MAKLSKLTKFLDRLDEADIHYTLSSVEEGTITVGVRIPDERWDVGFDTDGEIRVEIFTSDGDVQDGSVLEAIFSKAEAAETAEA